MMLYNFPKKSNCIPITNINHKYQIKPLTAQNHRSKTYRSTTSKNLTNIVTSKISRNSQVKSTYRKQCLNDQMFQRCKDNYLNSHYNKRKNQLKQITKENKKIYQRINSQKSFYSNKSFNKSYQNNAQISKRISKSKLSRRSSSKSVTSNEDKISQAGSSRLGSRISKHSTISNHSNKNNNIKINKNTNRFTGLNSKKQPTVKLESQNVNQLTEDHLKDFKSLFMRTSSTKNNHVANFGAEQNKLKQKNAIIKKREMSFKPAPFQNGFLHRIAQQMYTQKIINKSGQMNRKRLLF